MMLLDLSCRSVQRTPALNHIGTNKYCGVSEVHHNLNEAKYMPNPYIVGNCEMDLSICKPVFFCIMVLTQTKTEKYQKAAKYIIKSV